MWNEKPYEFQMKPGWKVCVSLVWLDFLSYKSWICYSCKAFFRQNIYVIKYSYRFKKSVKLKWHKKSRIFLFLLFTSYSICYPPRVRAGHSRARAGQKCETFFVYAPIFKILFFAWKLLIVAKLQSFNLKTILDIKLKKTTLRNLGQSISRKNIWGWQTLCM